MKKEVKVSLYRKEDDNYVELWKVINPEKGAVKYYGRYTRGNSGIWYYVSDPLGYCELDYQVSEDVVFVVCDEKGNEYVRYSNADENPLPKFEVVMKQKWKEVSEGMEYNTENLQKDFYASALYGTTTLSINQWLLTFKDPEIYKVEIEQMYNIDDNWIYCAVKEVSYEPVLNTEFKYLGHKYQFTKVTKKHDICGVEWVEYLCTDAPYVVMDNPFNKTKPYVNSYGYLGNQFDTSNVGTMLDKRTAQKMVKEALLKIYPKEKEYSKLLYVIGNYCKEASYADVAEFLINGDLHKDKIMELIKNLKVHTEKTVFAYSHENKLLIKEMYPDIYGYNYCLI